MDAHIKEWIDSRSAPRWTARWDHPLRGLGCGRRFLTQTQLPNRAGRTASLLLRLRFKSSKIIIIPLAPPTDLLLHGATAQGLGGSGGEGAVGGWQKRGGLKGSLSQIEGGRSRRRLQPRGRAGKPWREGQQRSPRILSWSGRWGASSVVRTRPGSQSRGVWPIGC